MGRGGTTHGVPVRFAWAGWGVGCGGVGLSPGMTGVAAYAGRPGPVMAFYGVAGQPIGLTFALEEGAPVFPVEGLGV